MGRTPKSGLYQIVEWVSEKSEIRGRVCRTQSTENERARQGGCKARVTPVQRPEASLQFTSASSSRFAAWTRGVENGIASCLRFNRIDRPDISICQFTLTSNALRILTQFPNAIDHLAAAWLAVELDAFPSTPRLKALCCLSGRQAW